METVKKGRETDNACSKASKRTVQVLRKPGASPLLFGKYLMESTAFITPRKHLRPAALLPGDRALGSHGP